MRETETEKEGIARMLHLPPGSVALDGPARTGKTRLLVQRVYDLLQTHPTDAVLVLCSNYYRKDAFLQQLQERMEGCSSQIPVTTYSALVRNTLMLFWPELEAQILKVTPEGHSVIFPELSGFEASEYIVRHLVQDLMARNPAAFSTFQGSQRSLITQLLRRIRLRAESRLSHPEMVRRSQLIGEICVEETAMILKQYDLMSSQLRVLDNSRQLDAFHRFLETCEPVQAFFRDRVRHLVVDDVDETIPAQQHFIKWLAPSLESLVIAADLNGGTRRGYLSAYPYDWEGLKQMRPEIQTVSLNREDRLFQAAKRLRLNWQVTDSKEIAPLEVDLEVQWRHETLYRHEMIDHAVGDIQRLLHQGFLPGDLVIVMPKIDALGRLRLASQMRRQGIPIQMLTGTSRPADNPICRGLLSILQLANQHKWELPLSPVEFKAILRTILKLHQVDVQGTEALVATYRKQLVNKDGANLLPLPLDLNPEGARRYQLLLDWLAEFQNEPLDEQFYAAFSRVICPYLTREDEMSDVHQVIRSFYIRDIAKTLAQAEDPMQAEKQWLIQAKCGIVADTPNKPAELDPAAVVLGTPQKIIDFEIERPIQLWLDVSSREWARTDNAPLYNAWVHSVNWDGDTTQASDAFTQSLACNRAAHITRTLMLYAGRLVLLYASQFDDEGGMHSGQLPQVLRLPIDEDLVKPKRAKLRSDQAPILTYQSGPMAVTAVPGAGKTFVNVEMILELIERGIAPESILVLTYMDSAARTLLSRVKGRLNNRHTKLPVISTIHSLAFRIITEGDHSLYLGLDSADVKILDDLERMEWIEGIMERFYSHESRPMDIRTADRGMTWIKSYQLTPEAFRELCQGKRPSFRLNALFTLYNEYEQRKRREGRLDFTDLIVKAIDLMEQVPEIRAKYQAQFQVVIEDEAQDSSELLQRLIELLTGGHGNLIRTGDTNQSITTTFSTAEVTVFRQFIQRCRQDGIVVEMNYSGRCAPQVMALANAFVDWAARDRVLRQAFQPVAMQPVGHANPELVEPITCKIFDTVSQEREWMMERIRRFQRDYPQFSIAILVRNNPQVQAVVGQLQDNGIKAISYSDSPSMNPVFQTVLYILRLLENPTDKEAFDKLLNVLEKLKLIRIAEHERAALCNHNLFAMHPSEIEHVGMLQLYYHLQELMGFAFGSDMCRLIVRLSDMFFFDPSQRSLGYLCAIKAQEWADQFAQTGTTGSSFLEYVIQEFNRYAQKNRLPFKGFQEPSESAHLYSEHFVHVMTLHKSKGQEFDLVWMPEMTEGDFPSQPEKVRWKEEDKIELEIDSIRLPTQRAFEEQMLEKKRLKVEEEARLVYVGLTRAKRALFLSCSLQGMRWSKPTPQEPCRYLLALNQILNPIEPQPAEEVAAYA